MRGRGCDDVHVSELGLMGGGGEGRIGVRWWW